MTEKEDKLFFKTIETEHRMDQLITDSCQTHSDLTRLNVQVPQAHGQGDLLWGPGSCLPTPSSPFIG